jgi:hypothetical protein
MRAAKIPNRNQPVKVLAWNKRRVYIRKQSKNVSVRNTVPCSEGGAGKAVPILTITDRRRHLSVSRCRHLSRYRLIGTYWTEI